MICPKCGYHMILKKTDTSSGSGKTYDREQYICNSDDIWVTVETPQEEEIVEEVVEEATEEEQK